LLTLNATIEVYSASIDLADLPENSPDYVKRLLHSLVLGNSPIDGIYVIFYYVSVGHAGSP
jgi:hypothetical protein